MVMGTIFLLVVWVGMLGPPCINPGKRALAVGLVVAATLMGVSPGPYEIFGENQPMRAAAESGEFDLEEWLRDEAVKWWGELSPQEARHTYLRQVPDILSEHAQMMDQLNKLTGDYIDGRVPRDEMLEKTLDLGLYSSEALEQAYLLTVLAPDDQQLGELDLSLNGLEASMRDVAWMIRVAVESGQRNPGIRAYLDMADEDWSRVGRLLEKMMADYRFANPTEANVVWEKLEAVTAQFR